jgi:hypothetical protein
MSLRALIILADNWPTVKVKDKDGKEKNVIVDDSQLKDMGFDI